MIRYDPHSWFDHFFDIRGTLLVEIFLRLMTCVVWSTGVVWVHQRVTPVAVPSTIHSLVGVALGLLLVFRTNASYDRFWEGRKLWGSIVNESRNLVRYGQVHLADDRELFLRLVRWTAVFPYTVMSTLRGDSILGPAADDLTPEERVELLTSQHLALHAAQRMTHVLKLAYQRGVVTDRINVALDQNVQLLVDNLGGCERIRKTPLPYAYVVHLRRALVLYCFTLPFALVDTFHWVTVPVVAAVAYLFFGIEEIGVEIEGPFGHDENDLPLKDICDTIYKNIYAMAELSDPPRDVDVQGL
ncbi:MAG: bestrophin family ion channel [Bryobacteraceae bacterium]